MTPQGSGSATGAGTYSIGSSVTLSASPSSGYQFLYWMLNDSIVSYDADYTFTAMEGQFTYVAVFDVESESHNVTLDATPEGSCTLVGAGTYPDRAMVTIQCIPNEGYEFIGWYDETDTDVSYDATFTFNADHDYTLIAKLRAIPSGVNLWMASNSLDGLYIANSSSASVGDGTLLRKTTPVSWIDDSLYIYRDTGYTGISANVYSDAALTRRITRGNLSRSGFDASVCLRLGYSDLYISLTQGGN